MMSDVSRYSLTPAARDDLTSIWRYTAKTWSQKQADAYITEITTSFEALISGARLGRPADHIRSGYRSLLIRSHVAYYKIVGTTLVVVRILHQRMDVPDSLG